MIDLCISRAGVDVHTGGHENLELLIMEPRALAHLELLLDYLKTEALVTEALN